MTWPPEVLNAVYMHYTRNRYVVAAERLLHGKLALIGKGWDKLGRRGNMDHAGDKSGEIYAQSQISLNLFGGCYWQVPGAGKPKRLRKTEAWGFRNLERGAIWSAPAEQSGAGALQKKMPRENLTASHFLLVQ